MSRGGSLHTFQPGTEVGRFGAYKWELIVLLWLAFFLNQADRQIYNVVLPLVKSDLHLSDVQLGLVASIFTGVFAVLVPFAGYAGDVLRRKWIIAGSLLFWSTATLFTGMSTGFLHLVFFRSITTGGGEAFYFPSATSLIGQIHHSTRALAISIHQTAVYAGLVASGVLAGYIGERFGWRMAFYAFGALGIVISLIVFVRLRDTPHPDPQEAQSGLSRKRLPLSTVAREVLRKPTVLALFLAYGGRIFANIGFLTWMPTHLHEKFGLSLAEAGFSSMFYYCGLAMIGTLLGGKLSDRWARTRSTVRLETQLLGLALAAPFVWLMGSADNLSFCLLGLAGFGLFSGIYDSNQIAGLFDVIAPRFRSSSVGMMVAFGFAVGAFAPVLLGWLKETHSLAFGISALSFPCLTAAACVLVATKLFFARDYVAEGMPPA
jgi:MFS family permease